MDFLTEDKLSVTDFLQIEKKKILRISIINDARSTKEKCWCFFLNVDIRHSFFPFCRGRGGAPFKLLGEGAAAPSLVAPLVNTAQNNLLPRKKLRSYKYILDLPRGIPASPVAQMVSTLRGMPRISKTKI